MLFNSYEYIFLFLPISFFIYFYLNTIKQTQGSKVFLVISSLFFYSWWNLSYLPIILLSMIVNFSLGKTLSKKYKKDKKIILVVGILFNLSLLGYFKYTDFLLVNINFFTNNDFPTLNLALPLAISFFTFQQIAYLVDSFKGETKEYNFLNYALFVSFFPQLIAGPIVHHKEMMPQFEKVRNKVKNYRNISLGLLIFTIGLFKKVAIADTFGSWATKGFDSTELLSFIDAWTTSLSYTFQLYFDFSGYSDMAIGAALLFNIKIPINFNSPYRALDIQDFWRRWHITLSRFLRDYIYIPLGGNQKGDYRTYNNLFVTFLIGGIWHGAGWTFIIWGMLHGMAIVLFRIWQPIKVKFKHIVFGNRMKNFGFFGSLIAWIVTFNFVNIAWVFFRANDLDNALKIIKAMIGQTYISLPTSFSNLTIFDLISDKVEYSGINIQFLLYCIIFSIVIHIPFRRYLLKSSKFLQATIFFLMLFIAIPKIHTVEEFLYFNF